MHAAIADKREELAELCRRYGVVRLEVFGSAARGVDFDPEASDADFLVECDPDSDLPPLEQFFGLVDALREALGRPGRRGRKSRVPQPVSASLDQRIVRSRLCVVTLAYC